MWLVYLAIYHIFFLPRVDISLGERVKQDQEDTTKFWKVNAVIKYAPEEKSLEVARYHFGRTFSEPLIIVSGVSIDIEPDFGFSSFEPVIIVSVVTIVILLVKVFGLGSTSCFSF